MTEEILLPEEKPNKKLQTKIKEYKKERLGKEEFYRLIDLSKFPSVEYKNYSESDRDIYPELKAKTQLNKVYLLKPSNDPSKLLVMLYVDYGYVKKNKLKKFYSKGLFGLKKGKIKATVVIRLFNERFCELAQIPMLHSSHFSEIPLSKAEHLFVGLIDKLEQNTNYYYHIECYNKKHKLFALSPLKIKLSAPNKSKSDPFLFVTASDLHGGQGAYFKRGKAWGLFPRKNKRLHQLFQDISKNRTDYTFGKDYSFFASSGDLVENGSYDEYWADLFECGSKVLSTVPIISCLGNHDYFNGGLFRGSLFGGFNRTSENFHKYIQTPAESGKEGQYFSFKYGNAHFCFIDSVGLIWGNERIDCQSPQYKWIDQDLKKWRKRLHDENGEEFSFVYNHSAILSLGFYGRTRNNSDNKAQTFILPLLKKYGVNASIFGHDHIYQRSKLSDTQFMCVGISGGAPYNFVNHLIDRVSYKIEMVAEGNRSRGYAVVYVPPNFEQMLPVEKEHFAKWLDYVKTQILNGDINKYVKLGKMDKRITTDELNNKSLREEYIDSQIIEKLFNHVWWRYYSINGELLDHVFLGANRTNYDSHGSTTYTVKCPENHVR